MVDKSSAGYFWCIFGILCCVNLPFIVVDLVFANEEGEGGCTNTPVPGISFTLGTWLQVDGYMRLAFVCLFLLVAIIACVNIECALKMFLVAICFVVIYSLFYFAWLIIGAVMFWGNLNKTGECSSQVSGYMWALLIIGFLGVCSNCYTSYSQRNSNNSGE